MTSSTLGPCNSAGKGEDRIDSLLGNRSVFAEQPGQPRGGAGRVQHPGQRPAAAAPALALRPCSLYRSVSFCYAGHRIIEYPEQEGTPTAVHFITSFLSLSLSLSPSRSHLATPQPPRTAGLLSPLSALLSRPFLRPQLPSHRPRPRFVCAPRRDAPVLRLGPLVRAALPAPGGTAPRCPLAALLRRRWALPPPVAPLLAPPPPQPRRRPSPERRRCPACHGAAPPQPRAALQPLGAVSTARGRLRPILLLLLLPLRRWEAAVFPRPPSGSGLRSTAGGEGAAPTERPRGSPPAQRAG